MKNGETIDEIRKRVEELAGEYIEKGDATGWFDALYREAGGDNGQIPWADLEPNRFLTRWAENVNLQGNGRKALVVGCGLGDDANFLNDLGFRVTAFDISPVAIEWARKIYPDAKIDFQTADLFDAPAEYSGAFDFVLEIYTIQALPISLRDETIDAVSRFVAPGGELLIVTRGREDEETPEGLPWSMSRRDLSRFESNGLRQIRLTEMFDDEEEKPVRRFVVEYENVSP